MGEAGQLLTILALFAVCVFFGAKLFAANRRAAGAKERADGEKAVRARRESELRERVERVKRKMDPLELSKRAVEDDPARAAKTLSRMMRGHDDER